MINLSIHLDTTIEGLDKFVIPPDSSYNHLEIHFKNSYQSLNIFMTEDQMIELMKVLQDHFKARAFPIPAELTPGEIVTIEEAQGDITLVKETDVTTT